MARHFFYGGIGLRQFVDYYFLLKYSDINNDRSLSEKVKNDLRYLGLEDFSKAVMWVLKEIVGMDDHYMLFPVDPKRGELLLDEILNTGNFGKYDKRLSGKLKSKSVTLSTIARNIRFYRLFPEEAFGAPIIGVCHFLKYKEKKKNVTCDTKNNRSILYNE